MINEETLSSEEGTKKFLFIFQQFVELPLKNRFQIIRQIIVFFKIKFGFKQKIITILHLLSLCFIHCIKDLIFQDLCMRLRCGLFLEPILYFSAIFMNFFNASQSSESYLWHIMALYTLDIFAHNIDIKRH